MWIVLLYWEREMSFWDHQASGISLTILEIQTLHFCQSEELCNLGGLTHANPKARCQCIGLPYRIGCTFPVAKISISAAQGSFSLISRHLGGLVNVNMIVKKCLRVLMYSAMGMSQSACLIRDRE